MFKNTTRRGLAIGAALSLAISGLASVPAQAAGEVVLVPSAGTSYTTFVTEDFTLQASLAPGQVPSTAQQLKYKIDKVAGSTVSYGVSTSSTVTTGTTLNAASTSVVVSAAGADALTQNFIKVAVTSATSVSPSVDVTVTAFIDANNNSVLDSGEFNTPRVLSFKKYSDVTSVVALTQPLNGDASFKGTASLTDINRSQVQGAVQAVVTVGGTARSAVTVAADGTFTDTVAATAAQTVSAEVQVRTFKVGASSATLTVTKASVVSISAAAVTSDNAKGTAVRPNGAFSVTAKALDANTSTASGVAAVAVTGKVSTSAVLSATKTITVNGTVYSSSATLQAASFALTTDASGNVTVAVSSAGLVAEAIEFNFSSQNVNAAALTLTQTAAVYTAKAAGTGFLTVAPSGAFSVAYTVADQYGVVAPAGHRLVVTYDGTTKYENLAAGAATVAFTSTASATTNNVTNGFVEAQSSTTLNWSSVSTAVTASAVAVKTTAVAASFTAAPTHSATASIARATTGNTAGLTNMVTISGQVNHAGQSVVVSSTVAKFSSATQGVAAVASTYATTADGAGYFTVSAYVSAAGTATFTYAAGTATASTTLTVGAAVGTAGTVLDITSNATGNAIEPGKTVVAKISLKDEFGNAVAADDSMTESFGVVVTGLGFVGSLPTKFSSLGEASVTVLLGSADEGNLVITATYSTDGTAAKQITKVLTIAVSKTAAPEINAVIGSYKGRVAVRVENAKGAVVSVKIGGKWFKYTSLNDNYLFSRVSRVGAVVPVAVYVNGQLENVATITIK